jgi:hypothetical protein
MWIDYRKGMVLQSLHLPLYLNQLPNQSRIA